MRRMFFLRQGKPSDEWGVYLNTWRAMSDRLTQYKEKQTSIYGELAQLGERLLCTQEAKSSNLLFSTMSGLTGHWTLKTEQRYQ